MIPEWIDRSREVIGCVMCYYTVNLGRGFFFSFLLLAVVMFFRKLPLFRNSFCRMILWSFFLWLPFIGRLKLFYETRIGVRGFLWWADWNYRHTWTGGIYFLVMMLYGGFLLYRRWRLMRAVKRLERLRENIYICDRTVTPFAAGLFFPKIVVPGVMVAEYGREDLETILFHEKMHIRLGHLWCLFVWDVLRVLFWPNFFLTLCAGELKADLEEMCDRVTIQRSGRSACEYGLLLLRCIRLLRLAKQGREPADAAAFAGETAGSCEEIGRRILKIADFSRYKTRNVIFVFLAGVLLLGGGFGGIHRNSYARYTRLESITILDDTGVHVILEDSEKLRRAVTFDEEKVTVRTEEMFHLLEESGTQTEGIYILFGGFMKQPGVGGGGDMVYADISQFIGEQTEIAYEKSVDATTWIFMMM
ncbi:transcriptional regulator [bacterium 1XD8-76]|nr:transcriptional regulator [bacterium 1XD8-76]